MRRLLPLLLIAAFAFGCSAFKRFSYGGFGRDDWQQPERVILELAIEPGMQVADIGAGGGYFTFRLADAVGPSGRVYAVDVDEGMTDYLEERAREDGYPNVTVILGEFGDPLLPDGQIDLIFTSNVYHHIENQSDYFGGVREDLKPGGRLAILELNEGPFLVRDHFTDPDQIVKDLEAAGYERIQSFDFIEKQSFQIFRPAGELREAAAPEAAANRAAR